jgi:hypothetical protein
MTSRKRIPIVVILFNRQSPTKVGAHHFRHQPLKQQNFSLRGRNLHANETCFCKLLKNYCSSKFCVFISSSKSNYVCEKFDIEKVWITNFCEIFTLTNISRPT